MTGTDRQITSQMTETRPLHEIAADIRSTWDRPYFGAVPYIEVMACLDRITDSYGADDAETIVAYFLVNARTWRGARARRIKDELKALTAMLP